MSLISNDYHYKYLKYKNKFITLQKQNNSKYLNNLDNEYIGGSKLIDGEYVIYFNYNKNNKKQLDKLFELTNPLYNIFFNEFNKLSPRAFSIADKATVAKCMTDLSWLEKRCKNNISLLNKHPFMINFLKKKIKLFIEKNKDLTDSQKKEILQHPNLIENDKSIINEETIEQYFSDNITLDKPFDVNKPELSEAEQQKFKIHILDSYIVISIATNKSKSTSITISTRYLNNTKENEENKENNENVLNGFPNVVNQIPYIINDIPNNEVNIMLNPELSHGDVQILKATYTDVEYINPITKEVTRFTVDEDGGYQLGGAVPSNQISWYENKKNYLKDLNFFESLPFFNRNYLPNTSNSIIKQSITNAINTILGVICFLIYNIFIAIVTTIVGVFSLILIAIILIFSAFEALERRRR